MGEVPTVPTSNTIPRANEIEEKKIIKVADEEKHTEIFEVPTSNTKGVYNDK
ncbi:2754_t:CDS:2, partial [Gigaspora margarita]